jgi:hypothetical protein
MKTVNLEQLIKAFSLIGIELKEFLRDPDQAKGNLSETIREAMMNAENANPWFIRTFQTQCLNGWAENLSDRTLRMWTEKYPDISLRYGKSSKRVAIIMAGNIPMVGFHDLLCCLVTGHQVMVRLSADDRFLIPMIFRLLEEKIPSMKGRVTFTTEKLENFDAVIATGSDNTFRYFEYYFGKFPHLFRKNRNSLAVLDGNESFSELDDLCNDIFTYFGLGCRSVSKIFVPEGYNFNNLTLLLDAWDVVGNHNKYRNNYDYRKSILLINRTPFIDHRNLLLVNDTSNSSPVAMLFFEYYRETGEVVNSLLADKDRIQCVVCSQSLTGMEVPFGQTQYPALWDYADRMDTIEFLLGLD